MDDGDDDVAPGVSERMLGLATLTHPFGLSHFGGRHSAQTILAQAILSHFGSSHFGSSYFGSSHVGSSHFGVRAVPLDNLVMGHAL